MYPIILQLPFARDHALENYYESHNDKLNWIKLIGMLLVTFIATLGVHALITNSVISLSVGLIIDVILECGAFLFIISRAIIAVKNYFLRKDYLNDAKNNPTTTQEQIRLNVIYCRFILAARACFLLSMFFFSIKWVLASVTLNYPVAFAVFSLPPLINGLCFGFSFLSLLMFPLKKLYLHYKFRKMDLNQEDADGKTPLSHAVVSCDKEKVDFLLTHPKIDPMRTDPDGLTPAQQARNLQTVVRLRDRPWLKNIYDQIASHLEVAEARFYAERELETQAAAVGESIQNLGLNDVAGINRLIVEFAQDYCGPTLLADLHASGLPAPRKSFLCMRRGSPPVEQGDTWRDVLLHVRDQPNGRIAGWLKQKGVLADVPGAVLLAPGWQQQFKHAEERNRFDNEKTSQCVRQIQGPALRPI